jgi:hypothetical protein
MLLHAFFPITVGRMSCIYWFMNEWEKDGRSTILQNPHTLLPGRDVRLSRFQPPIVLLGFSFFRSYTYNVRALPLIISISINLPRSLA